MIRKMSEPIQRVNAESALTTTQPYLEGHIMAVVDSTYARRFWAKVLKTETCWLWTGCISTVGYGKIGWQHRTQGAHRVAWILAHGDIPEGLWVLHKCESAYPPGNQIYRGCVNPDHLYLGTRRDNVDNMMATGRNACGGRHGNRLHPERVSKGERHYAAKLTESLVREIRKRHLEGSSQESLARNAGVSRKTIAAVIARKTWKHVE